MFRLSDGTATERRGYTLNGIFGMDILVTELTMSSMTDEAGFSFVGYVHPRQRHEGLKRANLIGKRLRKLREAAGISHVGMLKLLRDDGWEIDPAVLSRIEQGNRTLTDIEILAMLRVLKCRWGDLEG